MSLAGGLHAKEGGSDGENFSLASHVLQSQDPFCRQGCSPPRQPVFVSGWCLKVPGDWTAAG